MTRGMPRAVLALLVGMVGVSRVSAEEPASTAGAGPVKSADVPGPMPPAPAMPSPMPSGDVVSVCVGAARPGPLVGGGPGSRAHWMFNRHGYCCGVDPSIPGCPNLHEDLRFIFGSCRSFFGEPCLPKEPRLRAGERQFSIGH